MDQALCLDHRGIVYGTVFAQRALWELIANLIDNRPQVS